MSAEELTEGTAVRVDGQPVCPSCIEYLPQALQVQIQRVRALKGLATVTYRLRLPRRATQNLFTFTNAGLMLLHRRALIHGTEFQTPDLPLVGQEAPPLPAIAAKTHHAGPWLIIGAAAALLLLGIGVLVPLGKTSTPTPQRPPEPLATPPVASLPAPAPASNTVPEPAEKPAPVAAPEPVTPTPLTAAGYVQNHANTYQALLAAEADAAADEVRNQLLALTIGDRTRQLTNATQLLRSGISGVEAGEKALDAMPLPPERSEFKELHELEQTLRAKIAFYRRQAVQTPPEPTISAKNPTEGEKSPAASPPSGVATGHPAGAPELPVAAPTPAHVPVPAPVVATAPSTVGLFSGPFVNLTMCSPNDSELAPIPSPWPTVALSEPLLFGKSNVSKDPNGKVRNWCSFAIPAAQVTGGGINLMLHRNNASRKQLQVWRDDSTDSTPQVITLPTDEWTSVQLTIGELTHDTLNIRIEDSEENILTPFWLGPVSSVAGAKPTPEVFGLMPAALLTSDVARGNRDLLLTTLKEAAKERNVKQWFTPTQMPTREVQILCTGLTPEWKEDIYAQIKDRWKKTRNENNSVDNFFLPGVEAMQKSGAIPKGRVVVALMANGAENQFSPDEWTAKIRQISTVLVKGNASKRIPGGWFPVWIIGTNQNRRYNPAQWTKIRAANSIPLIDLTAAQNNQKLAARLLSDALQTLDFQLRWLQFNLATK